MSAKTERKEKSEGTITILKYVKSLFISLIITFASIILFAFVIKWVGLSDSVITPVNLVIKALSVFIAVLVLTKNKTRGLIKGISFAIVYTFASFIIFSILAGEFVLGLGLVADFAFNIIVGAITGLLFKQK